MAVAVARWGALPLDCLKWTCSAPDLAPRSPARPAPGAVGPSASRIARYLTYLTLRSRLRTGPGPDPARSQPGLTLHSALTHPDPDPRRRAVRRGRSGLGSPPAQGEHARPGHDTPCTVARQRQGEVSSRHVRRGLELGERGLELLMPALGGGAATRELDRLVVEQCEHRLLLEQQLGREACTQGPGGGSV